MATRILPGPAPGPAAVPGGSATQPDAVIEQRRLELIRIVLDEIASRAAHIERLYFCLVPEDDIPDGANVLLDTVRELVRSIGCVADYGLGALLLAGQVQGGIEDWLLPPVYQEAISRSAEEVEHV